MSRLLIHLETHRLPGASLEQLEDVQLEPASGPDDLSARARRAAAGGADRILVAGGDGTLHHAIRGLEGSSCALGIVPLGHANDLARALGVPLDPSQALRRALTAVPRRIDLGNVEGRSFAGAAGIGFHADVIRAARRGHRLPGRARYAWAVLRTLLLFRPPEVRVDSDAGSFEGSVMLVAVANSPYLGGGMMIAPQARLDDGELDLVIFEAVGRMRFLRSMFRIRRGSRVVDQAVRSMRIRHAEVRSPDELPILCDGETLGVSGASARRIEVRPRSLWVAA